MINLISFGVLISRKQKSCKAAHDVVRPDGLFRDWDALLEFRGGLVWLGSVLFRKNDNTRRC